MENRLPYRLPPLFRAYLISYCVLDMDFGEVTLPALPSDDPLRQVRRYLIRPDLWTIGYGPFASSHDDPVCFDLQVPNGGEDFAVVAINHDGIVPFENWRHRERVEPHEPARGVLPGVLHRTLPGTAGVAGRDRHRAFSPTDRQPSFPARQIHEEIAM